LTLYFEHLSPYLEHDAGTLADTPQAVLNDLLKVC
jgi:hypothetical protein